MSLKISRLQPAGPGRVVSELLAHSTGVAPDSALVCVGDSIDVGTEDGFLRGHGILLTGDAEQNQQELTASVCGVVQRVDKLILVKPYKCRYQAERGEVVVGRITDIVTRRWIVDIQASTHSSMMLSAVQLPGGIQRRRTADDELNMRSVYREGDIIAAEVQDIGKSDKSVALHMRSSKYRKLKKGQLVWVPSQLIQRRASHFLEMRQHGLNLVIGCNGGIWVGILNKTVSSRKSAEQSFDMSLQEEEDINFQVEKEQWEMCARYATAAAALGRLSIPIDQMALVRVVEQSIAARIACMDMLGPEFLQQIVLAELARRGSTQMEED